jgi:hypothetical protein
MKTAIAKVEQDPIHYELAEWFIRGGQDVRSKESILEELYNIRDSRGIKVDMVNKEYASYIMECREYLETKYKRTLINMRSIFGAGSYKVSNDSEQTEYGTRQYKQWILKGERVRRITPLMKREYLLSSMKKVFGDLREETERFKRLGELFLPHYEQEVKELKQTEIKQLQHRAEELTSGKRKLVKHG